MDDDVKNLFQKFGQSTDAYREINRDADSELARQRWPLLRDVHLHAGPAPARVQHREEELAAPVQLNDSPFRPAVAKSAVSRSTAVKTSPVQAAPEAHANTKHSSQLPLKQMLMQKNMAEEQEPEPETASPFLSRILPVMPKQDATNQKGSVSGGLFSSRGHAAPVPAPAREIEIQAHVAPITNARKPVNTAPPATVIHSIPAGHAMPVKHAHEHVEEARNQSAKTKLPAKDQPVSAVFGRLAGKQEEAKPADTGTNSFFKKIFKP